MANDKTNELRAAIWNDPQPLFEGTQYAGEWRQKGNAWQWRGGVVRLTRTGSGAVYLHGNHNSGNAGLSIGAVDYVIRESATDEGTAYKNICDRYGIRYELTQEQKDAARRERLAGVVFEALTRRDATGTPGAAYMEGRGFKSNNGVFAVLTREGITEAKSAAISANIEGVTAATIEKDFEQLGVTEKRAATHPVVLPNKTDGRINGLCYRATSTDNGPKYLFSQGLKRGAYCDRLEDTGRAVIVEGQLDAERLKLAGIVNVIALGGATPGDEVLKMLRRHGITDVVYWPDCEYKEGKRKTELERRAVDKLIQMKGEGYNVAAVRVVDVQPEPGANLNSYKLDPDGYAMAHTPEDVEKMIYNAKYWYFPRMEKIERETMERATAGTLNPTEAANNIRALFASVTDPVQQQLFINRVEGAADFYKSLGITRRTLENLDDIRRKEAARHDMEDAAAYLNKAIQSGDPERIRGAVADLNETTTRNNGSRDAWDKQFFATWDDVLNSIAEQPEPIKTRFTLGRIKGGDALTPAKYTETGEIDIWADDVTIFCAQTSHGKTLFLFQLLIDLIGADINAGRFKKYIYISKEETGRQLYARALNTYISPKGLKEGSRRAIIRAFARGEDLRTYTTDERRALADEVERFKAQFFPRIALINTPDSVEAIAGNVEHYKTLIEESGADFGGVFVDYFQLLDSDRTGDARNYELKTICKVLKESAQKSGVPYVVAAQLNREALKNGVDSIQLANIGEGADIERIATDVYLVWNCDKTHKSTYVKNNKTGGETKTDAYGERAGRIINYDDTEKKYTPLEGYLYVERLKGRNSTTGVWGLFPFDGESGQIGNNRDGNTIHTTHELPF